VAVPTQPTLTLTRTSATSFQATVSGADGGTTNTVYYRQVGTLTDVVGPAISGNGSAGVSGLPANGSFLAWVVSDNGASKSLPAVGTVALAAATDTLSGAMVQRFLQDPALAALCPQFYFGEIQETDAAGEAILPPFALLEVPEEKPEWNFEGSYHDIDQATITVYANTTALVDLIAAVFQADYDWQGLPFATARTVQLMRTNSRPGREELQDANGNRVFHRMLDYQVMVTR